MANWKKVEFSDIDHFDDGVADYVSAAAASNQPLYVMITSDFSNEEMCERWCPDCRSADPIVYAALDRKGTGILFECPVARSSYRGNPEHPFRKHPVLQIKAIPTLINWSTGDRLVEAECYDTAKVAAFFGVSE